MTKNYEVIIEDCDCSDLEIGLEPIPVNTYDLELTMPGLDSTEVDINQDCAPMEVGLESTCEDGYTVEVTIYKGRPGDKGWAPEYDSLRVGEKNVFRLIGYVGGEGEPPIDHIGEYLAEGGGYTTDVDLAQDFRGIQGPEGPIGPQGDIPDHKWEGTSLIFQKPDGDWGIGVDLKGPKGEGFLWTIREIISEQTTIYQHPDLINASIQGMIVLNKTSYDYIIDNVPFDPVLGTLNFSNYGGLYPLDKIMITVTRYDEEPPPDPPTGYQDRVEEFVGGNPQLVTTLDIVDGKRVLITNRGVVLGKNDFSFIGKTITLNFPTTSEDFFTVYYTAML